jgi:hypothetical protein
MAIAKIVFADGSDFNICPPLIPKIINGGLTVLYTSQWTVLRKLRPSKAIRNKPDRHELQIKQDATPLTTNETRIKIWPNPLC